MRICQVEITPIKPSGGLVGFASCVVDEWLYLSSIGIMTRLSGGYRLTYPTKLIGDGSVSLFHPINKNAGQQLELTIINAYENVMKKSNDRYHCANT